MPRTEPVPVEHHYRVKSRHLVFRLRHALRGHLGLLHFCGLLFAEAQEDPAESKVSVQSQEVLFSRDHRSADFPRVLYAVSHRPNSIFGGGDAR